jgi:hypothetical protein
MLARIFPQVNRFRVDDCELPYNCVGWEGWFSGLTQPPAFGLHALRDFRFAAAQGLKSVASW